MRRKVHPVSQIFFWFPYSQSKFYIFKKQRFPDLLINKNLIFSVMSAFFSNKHTFFTELQGICPFSQLMFHETLIDYLKEQSIFDYTEDTTTNIRFCNLRKHAGSQTLYVFGVHCCRFFRNMLVYDFIPIFKSFQLST